MLTRIAVFVSGGGTNLQALIDASRDGLIPSGSIELVISSRSDAYAISRATSAGIKSVVVEKKSCSQEEFESQIQKALDEHSIDMIVLAGFMSILGERFTSRWDGRIINVHPSLIPAFCGKGYYGLHVHEAALARGVRITGATVHYVNEIPDGGDIILQRAVEVMEGDTAESLQRRVMEEAEWKILPEATEIVARELLRENATDKCVSRSDLEEYSNADDKV